jgi:hypothetical protein
MNLWDHIATSVTIEPQVLELAPFLAAGPTPQRAPTGLFSGAVSEKSLLLPPDSHDCQSNENSK